MTTKYTPRVTLYDTTLRDGAQTSGVDFSPEDKQAVAVELNLFGIPYIEAGWPGANDTDTQVFEDLKKTRKTRKSLVAAFGMTRRVGMSADNDPGLRTVVTAGADAICLVGKTWEPHIVTALGTTPEENLKSIHDSVALAAKHGEAIYDAEHFFDAYRHDRAYALQALKIAEQAGARWLTLCDTNGGAGVEDMADIVKDVIRSGIPGEKLGIHTHDDEGCAVANSRMAVNAGVHMVQGTLNGLGERCGNANLITLIPSFMKRGLDCGISQDQLRHLTRLSRFLDDLLDRPYNEAAPYVGKRAFTHKGGLHVSAIEKDPSLYEHFNPAAVGNTRIIPMSDQGGLANLRVRMGELGLDYDPKDARLKRLANEVKAREATGFSYDQADASFELLLRRRMTGFKPYFAVERAVATTTIHSADNGEDMVDVPEATMKIWVAGQRMIRTSEGNGPVNALDRALREALEPVYPQLKNIRLADYKVRIPKNNDATGAMTRVSIEHEAKFGDETKRWTTIGVSTNIMQASLTALTEGVEWYLFKQGVPAMEAQPEATRNGGTLVRLHGTNGTVLKPAAL